jgi:hypothetical protein
MTEVTKVQTPELTDGFVYHEEETKVEAPPKPKKKRASGASSKPASAPKKKRAKPAAKRAAKTKKKAAKPSKARAGSWAETHGQLVVHATPELIKRFQANVARLGKSLKVENPTRGSVLRAMVEAACKRR